MGRIYKYLGMTVGLLQNNMPLELKRPAYQADVTYGTNSEFGFDYLRDNMAVRKENLVQRGLNFAIVDEVDSILIDEARTPLIISGAGEASSELYEKADRFVRRLTRGENLTDQSRSDQILGEQQAEDGDYQCDIKKRTVQLTAAGVEKAEKFFGIESLSDPDNTEINHHIFQALRAHALFQRDKDYVVQDGQVIIVDEFTGRLMLGRRYNEGLHQALEAKEGVKVERENRTLATITVQNYFRMYKKLAGMTGTAKTEESEFMDIYDIDVVEIPTNRPLIRRDDNDVVYNTEEGKYRAVVDEIAQVHATGQPLLVGTISVERSEYLSGLLKRRGAFVGLGRAVLVHGIPGDLHLVAFDVGDLHRLHGLDGGIGLFARRGGGGDAHAGCGGDLCGGHVGGEVHALRDGDRGDQRDDGGERFDEHRTVADHANLVLLLHGLRGQAGAHRAVEAGEGAAGDGDEQERE